MRARRPDIAILFIDRRHRGYEVAARIRMRIGAIMRPDHPLAGRDEVTLTDCAAYPCLHAERSVDINATAEAEFTHSGAQFKSVLLTNSLPMTKEVMFAGLGIGFFTPTGFVDELKSDELVHVPMAEPDLSASEIGLLIHRDRHSSPAVRVLGTRLVKEFVALERDIGVLTATRPTSFT